MFKDFIASITHNVISLIGTALAVASLVLMACLFAIQQFGYEGGPYIGILMYLILPMFFVLGLALIPVGAILYRRKLRKLHGKDTTELLPVFDLNKPHTQRWMLIFLGATIVNIVILASATYKGVHYMESVEFCGLTCHTVMHGTCTLPAFARQVCRLPYRPRRGLVREVQARWGLAGGLGRIRPVSASRADTPARPASGARDLRAVSLANEAHRRQAQGYQALQGG
jgi:uncharacterized membrane protein